MQEYVIHPLVVGANETDQGVMTYLKGYGKRIWIPIYVFYLEGGPGKDPGGHRPGAVHGAPRGGEQYGLKIQEFEEALATFGLKPEDIDIIIHTHLHNDHCENDYKCTNARVYVQKKEYEFFKEPHPVDHRYFPDLLDDVEVVQVDGDAEIVDGIRVLLTPGHTVGGQSMVVNTRRPGGDHRFLLQRAKFPRLGPPFPSGSTSISWTPMRAPTGSKKPQTSLSPSMTCPSAATPPYPLKGGRL